MVRPVAALAVLLAAAPVHAWDLGRVRGNGEKTTEARDVPAFSRVRLECSLDAVVRVGGAPAVSVTIDSNLQPQVETRVDGDTLVISTRRSISHRGVAKVEIAAPALAAFAIRGSGDATIEGATGGDAQLSIEGSGDLRWTGAARNLSAHVEGSGDVALTGRAEALEVSIAGSGDVHAEGLAVRNARVRVDGSGDVDVQLAGGSLDAEVSGSGDVHWSGEGRVERAQVSGSGEIGRR